MSRNEGTIDRALRVIAGLAILSLVFIGPQTPWAWIGLVPLITGLVGFCPLYRVLGINTWGLKPLSDPDADRRAVAPLAPAIPTVANGA